jgi:hypothetical protein
MLYSKMPFFISRYPFTPLAYNMSSPQVKRARLHDSEEDDELIAVTNPLVNVQHDTVSSLLASTKSASSSAGVMLATHCDIMPHLLRFIDDDAALWRMRLVCSHWSRFVPRVFALDNPYTTKPRRVTIHPKNGGRIVEWAQRITAVVENIAPFFARNSARSLMIDSKYNTSFVLSPLRSFASLKCLELQGCTINTVSLMCLTSLESLRLGACLVLGDESLPFEDELCDALAKTVRHLDVVASHTRVSSLTRFTQLRSLVLRGTDFCGSDCAADVLRGLPSLRVFQVRQRGILFAGETLRCVPQLRELRTHLSHGFYFNALCSCTALRKLYLRGYNKWSAKHWGFDMSSLAHLHLLEDLTLRSFTLVGEDPISYALPSLQRLKLKKIHVRYDDFTRGLSRLRCLRVDMRTTCLVTHEDFIDTLPALEELFVCYGDVSDCMTREFFQRLPSLRYVYAPKSRVHDSIKAEFKHVVFQCAAQTT